MCGILGLSIKDKSHVPSRDIVGLLRRLMFLSESRGKEAAGIAALSGANISVYKLNISASALARDKKFVSMISSSLARNGADPPDQYHGITIIGHARLVTNGDSSKNDNNQPVVKEGIVCAHNGIITNEESLWRNHPELDRIFDVDTEVLISLIKKYSRELPLPAAVRKAFNLIKGTASVAMLFDDSKTLLLATNNGSLYTCLNDARDCLVFSSELAILNRMSSYGQFKRVLGPCHVEKLEPNNALLVDIETLGISSFSLANGQSASDVAVHPGKQHIINHSPQHAGGAGATRISVKNDTLRPETLQEWYEKDLREVDKLRRCTRCLLPETVPFIEFDEHGVCNFCTNYHKINERGDAELRRILEPFRRNDGRPDCIVPFSGGRDSSFGLHYLRTVLGMNPIAYSYDWGMLTDLGRRNQARLCGKLGIEHILVSADIARKRANIRANILAWLKKPDLGMVPLFMAGDKQFFYYANKLMQQTGVKLVVYLFNPLEKTDFKSGFCGVAPRFSEKSVYYLSLLGKTRILSFYAGQYLRNPRYFNQSLVDTLGAFAAYYVMKHHYIPMYYYKRWDEQEIESTLIKEYEWETALDTKSTWRIGDGTAPFYNYIYFTMAGFTENDTFRSNQIREGMITREQALQQVRKDNAFRYESIKWYCDTVNIDMKDTLEKINKAPKLYSKR
ncbi:MAG: hypothetical protein HY667_03905 [Chloroflexi bacterium]|nr:hypothetical protein [Chloroflexota bacterium]